MAVNKPPAKKGRPKSAQTLEREKTEAWLKNPPAHILPMTEEDKEWLRVFLESSEKARKSILEAHSPLIPHSLIYDLESIGHELLEGYEQAILNKYEEYKNKELIGRVSGSEETASQADTLARRLWGKNGSLVKRIQSDNLTPNGAAKIIFDDWKNKGIEGGKPSIKTISNWYKRIRPN
jgi:hypothetical protein